MLSKRIFVLVFVVALLTLLVGCLGTTPIKNKAPEIISSAVTSGRVGVAYTYEVEATDPNGDALTYSLTTKPDGMVIDKDSGVITWTPVAAGGFDVEVMVSDGVLSDIQPFNISVTVGEPMEITVDLPVFKVGIPAWFTVNMIANGDSGKKVEAHFPVPKSLTDEDIMGTLQTEIGSAVTFTLTGDVFQTEEFTMEDTEINFRGIFTSAGTYSTILEVKTTGGISLCSESITIVVTDLVHNINTGKYYHTIQAAINDNLTLDGNTIEVSAGTYNEGLINIDKSLTIEGDLSDKPIILPTEDTINAGHRGWFQVTGANTIVDFKNLEFDGSGKNIENAIRYQEGPTGDVENCDFSNISWSEYVGFAIVYVDYTAMDGGASLNIEPDGYVKNCTFTNIKRVGVSVFGVDAVYLQNNTFSGKGDGNWLDYGIEVGGGGVAFIEQNTINNCTGIASSDGSTSAGILVTTYFGGGTTATITGNTLTDNTGGIAVGYDETDTSVVVANYNNILENTSYGIDSTAPSVDAINNWWGDASGPSGSGPGTGDAVSDNVLFDPWLKW